MPAFAPRVARSALAQQRAVEFQGTVTDAATKASGSFTMILERPNRLYREVTIGGESRREAYNGKSAGARIRAVSVH